MPASRAVGGARRGGPERRRAQLRQRLLHVQAVAAAEQREQVFRVVRRHRQAAPLRIVAGQDGRQCEAGVLGDGARVAEPRRPVGKRREMRVQRRIDAAVGVEQGDERQLVEDDDDDRRRGAEGDIKRWLLVGRPQQTGDTRGEQERRRHYHESRREKGGEQAERCEADVREASGRAATCRQRQREAGVPAAERLERRERDGRSEAANHDPGGARPPSGCQPADDPERKRSDGGSGQAEQ